MITYKWLFICCHECNIKHNMSSNPKSVITTDICFIQQVPQELRTVLKRTFQIEIFSSRNNNKLHVKKIKIKLYWYRLQIVLFMFRNRENILYFLCPSNVFLYITYFHFVPLNIQTPLHLILSELLTSAPCHKGKIMKWKHFTL